MIIIPAIDLKDGACVRLEQGRMEKATVFSKEPGKTASQWAAKGAKRLHVVDLNGAMAGKPRNESAIKDIISKVDFVTDPLEGWAFQNIGGSQAVSYTHLTLPTNREV